MDGELPFRNQFLEDYLPHKKIRLLLKGKIKPDFLNPALSSLFADKHSGESGYIDTLEYPYN